MAQHRIPRPVLIAAAVGLIALIWWRRRAAKAAAAPAGASFPVMPIPVSFSYLQDNAPGPGGVVPAPGIDAGSFMLLQQLQNALVSNADAIAGLYPRAIAGTSSTAGPSYVPQPVQIGGSTYMGQLTEGGRGETEYFTSPSQLVGSSAANYWKGPGRYTRLKMPPSVPGGGQDTEWIYAGA